MRRAAKPEPLIGITTYAREPHDNRAKVLEVFRSPSAYSDAVTRGGGVPLLISPAIRNVQRLAQALDGILLVGGGDINPSRYGAQRHPSVYSTDDERDELEVSLTRAFIDAGKPILGICRGIQMLNVALHGDLIQHLPDVRVQDIDHAGFPSPPGWHAVTLEPDSLAAKVFQQAAFDVTTWHHQAVGKLGDGLRVVGAAPDGIVEAVELPDHPWCLGVQWHPEIDAGVDPTQQRLFTRFVAAARPS
ncbi:gamma-glutamyl-gamma-aminobutyrate hydrolase family protein [Candidatus Poribacteria bacterium]|nr:gamma-glutamyl-gamma-aminobutyrate hydrolase family protein [Candidatus Poribacteria bacterium]